jgi:DNA-binding CsgD family transcriptional regulator
MPKESAAAKAATEARALLGFVKTQSVESLRAEIGTATPYRRKVRLCFDLLVCRMPRHGSRLRHRRNVNTAMVSTELKAELVRLLRAGWSQKRISENLPVGRFTVEQLGKQIGAALVKRGRGRRLSLEQKQEIVSRLKAGARSIDVAREFGIDLSTVWTYRHQKGQ